MKVLKSKWIKWEDHVARMGEIKIRATERKWKGTWPCTEREESLGSM
jgi:hypothetical protein